jgi:class 3 adenylate cyclase
VDGGRRIAQNGPDGGLTVRGLLFTDIEGSTSLIRRLGPGFDAVLERHEAIIRSAVRSMLGVEQSREGDSMFITFPSASAAVEGAVEAQHSADLLATASAARQRQGLPLSPVCGLEIDQLRAQLGGRPGTVLAPESVHSLGASLAIATS